MPSVAALARRQQLLAQRKLERANQRLAEAAEAEENDKLLRASGQPLPAPSQVPKQNLAKTARGEKNAKKKAARNSGGARVVKNPNGSQFHEFSEAKLEELAQDEDKIVLMWKDRPKPKRVLPIAAVRERTLELNEVFQGLKRMGWAVEHKGHEHDVRELIKASDPKWEEFADSNLKFFEGVVNLDNKPDHPEIFESLCAAFDFYDHAMRKGLTEEEGAKLYHKYLEDRHLMTPEAYRARYGTEATVVQVPEL